MNERTRGILHLIAKGLLSLMMLGSAGMYFAQHQQVAEIFTNLGYPSYLIYPLAFAKILGVLAIWLPSIPSWLRQWAYAGFFYDLALAIMAHLMTHDGEQFPAIMGMVLLITILMTQPKETSVQ